VLPVGLDLNRSESGFLFNVKHGVIWYCVAAALSRFYLKLVWSMAEAVEVVFSKLHRHQRVFFFTWSVVLTGRWR